MRVFESRVLRKIFGSEREEVTGEWRKLRNEELNDRYYSPNIVRVIKSRRMSWEHGSIISRKYGDWGQDFIVGIAIHYGLDGLGMVSWW
jgi:hypothetical protein